MSSERTVPRTETTVNTTRYDPGWKWCAHFRCKRCPGWTADDPSERQLCWESETGEEALEAAFCEEDTPEGAGRTM